MAEYPSRFIFASSQIIERPVRISAFALLLLFLILQTTTSVGQHAVFTYSCDSVLNNCDTVLAEYYDNNNRLTRKIRFAEENSLILFEYDSLGRLTGKKHRAANWQLTKNEKYFFDAGGQWTIDSIFGKNDELLMVLTRQRGNEPGMFLINWYFRTEKSPMTSQIVKEDSKGTELSNSTCYSPDNCITYINKFNNGRKIFVELWVMSPETGANPTLAETEELIYDAQGTLAGRVRFKEPEHIILERNKYEKVEGLLPYKKY